MLWNSKEHCINNLWIRYDISNFFQCVENSFKCSTLIMNNKSFYIFKEECLRLITAQYLSNIKEQSSSCLLKTKSLSCKGKSLTWKTGT